MKEIPSFILFSLFSLGLNGLSRATEDYEDPDCLYSIGFMSGTSMDGIDAALLQTDGVTHIKELGHTSLNYSSEFQHLLKTAQYTVNKYKGVLKTAEEADFMQNIDEYLTEVLKFDNEKASEQRQAFSRYLKDNPETPITFQDVIQHSTDLHAQAVAELLEKTGHKSKKIDVIGYHGQTLFHRPKDKITIQAGYGQKLADDSDITVVTNFRLRDVQAGGQGAPFAPLYHQALAIRDGLCPLTVVNCGGIANISVIGGPENHDLIGFDTGPGNALIDLFVKQHTGGKENMDKDGQYGLKGTVNEDLLAKLYEGSVTRDVNYFDTAPPKSLDVNEFMLIPALYELTFEDACATLAAFTADSIVRSLDHVTHCTPKNWILAGGGWNNPVIKRELEERLRQKLGPDAKVYMAEEKGWNNKAMEAQIFAYLAVRSLKGLPISIPETTKVPEPLSGGHAYIPSLRATLKVQKLLEMNPAVLRGYKEGS